MFELCTISKQPKYGLPTDGLNFDVHACHSTPNQLNDFYPNNHPFPCHFEETRIDEQVDCNLFSCDEMVFVLQQACCLWKSFAWNGHSKENRAGGH